MKHDSSRERSPETIPPQYRLQFLALSSPQYTCTICGFVLIVLVYISIKIFLHITGVFPTPCEVCMRVCDRDAPFTFYLYPTKRILTTRFSFFYLLQIYSRDFPPNPASLFIFFFLSPMVFCLFYLSRDCDRSLISFDIMTRENSISLCYKCKGTFHPALILFHFFLSPNNFLTASSIWEGIVIVLLLASL